jgi:Zn-dependent protease
VARSWLAWLSAARLPLGRVAGFPVYLSPSWLLLAAALTIGYVRVLGSDHQPLPVAVPYLLGAALALCLLASVLLHELGHALVCRWHAIEVRAITLEMLGGHTELGRDAPGPRAEAAVSMAGPAVSFAIGLLGTAATVALPAHTAWHVLAFQVAASNLVIAVFNSLPGLPLDGGRALFALLWSRTGDPYLAARIAGRAGWALAVAALAGAVAIAARGGTALVAAAAVALAGLGVVQGAAQAVRAGRLGPRLPLLDVAALARPVYRVPAGTALAEAHRQAVAAGATGAVLGVAGPGDVVVALVDPAADAAVPAERRATVAVDEVASALDGRVLAPDLRGADLLDAIRADPTGEYLVASGEDVVGVLRGVDVANLLMPRETAR